MRTAKQMLAFIKSHVHGDKERFYFISLQLAASEARLGHHALDEELGLPLFSILLHAVITKFMGETAAKLRLVFDAMTETRGVYLFDEVDALGTKRTKENDVGEIRRILNSFLQFLEQDQGEALIIATTNHEELLDKALFRRFDAIFKYHLPTKDLIISAFQSRLSICSTDEVYWQEVAEKGAGLSQADIVGAAEDAARNAILSRGAPIVRTSDLIDAIESRKSIV